jgi:4-deoxy-L-threo-5-hexosulose-uronate ketol-isomerase
MKLTVRDYCNQKDYKHYDTARLREEFLIEDVFGIDEAKFTYSYIDRIIAGGIVPATKEVVLDSAPELRSPTFLARREMGVINIGGKGIITVDGVKYELGTWDAIYVGRGVKVVTFDSADYKNPAKFYINSCPAHKEYPTVLIPKEKADNRHLGSKETCNERTIHRYIVPETCKSCQLDMGLTHLEEGSIWNTMPCHTHARRMEVYLYFDIKPTDCVFHFMGPGDETRHLVMHNEEAVISPSWSIHSGAGTRNYTFIWGMCGENQDFDDMDEISAKDLK